MALRSRRALAIAAASALALGGGTLSAAAGGRGHGHGPYEPPPPTTVTTGLVGALSFDVTGKGLVVGQPSGAIDLVRRDGTTTQLVAPSGDQAEAVSVHGRTISWATTPRDATTFEPSASTVWRTDGKGKVRKVADILAFEKKYNPDKKNTYGFLGLDASCAAYLPPDFQPHPGIIDVHPYQSVTRAGKLFIADAGANAILSVDHRGKVRTVAVLPPVKVKVTAEMAAGVGLPDCVVGATFALDPVPTDVEVGPRGMLYVSTLPGGPEDGSLGALGGVWKVDPRSGRASQIATGFSGATNLAVTRGGDIYVTEMFGGKVTKLSKHGKRTTVLEQTMPVAAETAGRSLYVLSDPFATGTLQRLRLR